MSPRAAWARAARLVAAATAIALAGCGRPPRRAVIGVWESEAGQMRFYRDGKILIQAPNGTASITRYEFPERDLMRITDLGAAPADYRVTVTRDSLVMCRVGGDRACSRLGHVPDGE